jgi:hypothetical protein
VYALGVHSVFAGWMPAYLVMPCVHGSASLLCVDVLGMIWCAPCCEVPRRWHGFLLIRCNHSNCLPRTVVCVVVALIYSHICTWLFAWVGSFLWMIALCLIVGQLYVSLCMCP